MKFVPENINEAIKHMPGTIPREVREHVETINLPADKLRFMARFRSIVFSTEELVELADKLGLTLYKEYLEVSDKNTELNLEKLYPRSRMKYFHFTSDKPKEIWMNFTREHPMGGYNLSCYGKISLVKGKYRVWFRINDNGITKYEKEFSELEKALKYVIPDFKSLLTYWND